MYDLIIKKRNKFFFVYTDNVNYGVIIDIEFPYCP